MEFLDDDTSRPRFLFQSRPTSSPSTPQTLIQTSKLIFTLCLLSSLLLLLAAFHLSSHSLSAFLLAWLAFSLLLGPFAPPPLTAGSISVGLGNPLPNPADDVSIAPPRRKSRPKSDPETIPTPHRKEDRKPTPIAEMVKIEETDWTEDDVELLKKTMAKHPVGTPRRWEVVSNAFGGRHGVESVIKMAKGMGERRPGKDDSFANFLKQRKAVDERVVEATENSGENWDGNWSGGEDIALLNALKAFPKETAMRWEKIEAAVPGRSKGDCVKRVAVLKKGFRSAKATPEA